MRGQRASASPLYVPAACSSLSAARAAKLPAIRLHDLRHTTLALRAGIHPRIVQERLGHANVSITLDTNSHVDLDMQAAAARQGAALVAAAPPPRAP